MRHWFAVGRLSLDRLPDDYLVIDTETTGVFPSVDLVAQFGWVMVRGRKVHDRGSVFLDWTRYPQMDQDWLRSRLEAVKAHFASRGQPCFHTYERLAAEGLPIDEVFPQIFHLLEDWVAQGKALAGHNLFSFDRAILDTNFQRFCPAYKLSWPSNCLIDTGMIEKASQLYLYPEPEETIDNWYRRVRDTRSRVLWNLVLCVERTGLVERYGLDLSQAHAADQDAYMTHLLIEHYRRLAEEGE